MKLQYLGDAKDSFKWDYHDYVTHTLGFPQLTLVLMLTEDDTTTDGQKPPEYYPARAEVVRFCHALQQHRTLRWLRRLPEQTGAPYSVALHKGSRRFTADSRHAYFEGLQGDVNQVVFVDPDTGFEPESSRYSEKHVRFCEVNRLVEQITTESVMSVFQHARRFQPKRAFAQRYAAIRRHLQGFSTALYWDVSAMFILLSRSEQVIQQVRRITEEYRREVVARRPDFQDRLQRCVGG